MNDDRDVILRVRDGEPEAFRAIVERYQSIVYRTVREYVFDHQEAEDVAQEAFVRAFRHLDRFDVERSFLPWIVTIARNLAINQGKKRRDLAVETPEANAAITVSPQETEVEVSDLAEKILDAAESLPVRYRAVFHLFYRDELSVAEIAAALEVPEGTVKSDLFRARAMIRQVLDSGKKAGGAPKGLSTKKETIR